MKNFVFLLFTYCLMCFMLGCNDEPDFIKNAPPSSQEGADNSESDDTDSDDSETGDAEIKADPNFHIYLCFGQSNMEGNAAIELQDLEGIDERFQMMAVVSDGWQRQAGKWYRAVPPLCRHDTGLTPADYFGRTLVEKEQDIKVGVIMVAIGGAGIKAFHKTDYTEYYQAADAWQRGLMDCYDGYPYGKLVEMAKKAQKQGVIKGILMHQGETDAFQDYWESKVQEIYDDLVIDLNLKPEETPFLVGEMCREKSGVGLNDTKIPNLRNFIANCHVVPSKDCPGNDKPDDMWHFSAEGYRQLGRNYADVMLKVQAGEPTGPTEESENPDISIEDLFEVKPEIFGRLSGDEKTKVDYNAGKVVNAGGYGIMGWSFPKSVNLKDKGYLIVELVDITGDKPWFVIGDKGLYGESYRTEAVTERDGKYYAVIDLSVNPVSNISPNDGTEIDGTINLEQLTFVGLQCGDSSLNTSYIINRVYVSDINPITL